jgi:hypothetical protein
MFVFGGKETGEQSENRLHLFLHMSIHRKNAIVSSGEYLSARPERDGVRCGQKIFQKKNI